MLLKSIFEQGQNNSSSDLGDLIDLCCYFSVCSRVQEVREMRSRHESRLMELDTGRQKEFEGKLAEAMKQLREEHESHIQQYKDELEKTFAAKVQQSKNKLSVLM